MINNMNWPKVGDKLKFKGVPKFLYPNFTNIRKLAEDNLVIDKEYTVRTCDVHSSWCSVAFEEFPKKEYFFHLAMFYWKY